jgi:hypothetical protein
MSGGLGGQNSFFQFQQNRRSRTRRPPAYCIPNACFSFCVWTGTFHQGIYSLSSRLRSNFARMDTILEINPDKYGKYTLNNMIKRRMHGITDIQIRTKKETSHVPAKRSFRKSLSGRTPQRSKEWRFPASIQISRRVLSPVCQALLQARQRLRSPARYQRRSKCGQTQSGCQDSLLK